MCFRLLILVAFPCVFAENVLDEHDIPGLEYLNKSADPCLDFYEFTCGNFKQIHPKPHGNLALSDNFELLRTQMSEIISDILQTHITNDDPAAVQKAKMAYKACMHSYDTDDIGLTFPELRIIEEAGGLPLVEFKDDVKFSWNDAADLVAKYGVPILFKLDVVNPLGIENTIFLSKDSGLQLPDFIRPDNEMNYDKILEQSFQEYGNTFLVEDSTPRLSFDIFLEAIVSRFRNVLNPDMEDFELYDNLEQVKCFMRTLSQGGDMTEIPDDLPPSKISLRELNAWTKKHFEDDIDLDWTEFMRRSFQLSSVNITDNIEIIHTMPREIYGVLNLVRKATPAVLKNFALLRLFIYLAPDSDSYMRDAFENYYRSKNYTLYPRWQYCARKLSDIVGYASLSFAVTHQYQKYYFDVNKLAKAVTMIKDLETVFKNSVGNVDWMDNVTKQAASKKAQNMLTLLAYPTFIEDEDSLNEFYENMRICEWDHYGNSQMMRAFQQAYGFSQIGKKKSRTFWNKSPFEVNAYYNKPNNRMTFPVSMLNPLFFTGKISVLDYGRIGSIIGHEITHGFDSEGSKFDQNGILSKWWTNETLEAFNKKTQCFVEQYSSYHVEELNKQIDGAATLNENLADNGGLRNAHRAYLRLKAREDQLQRTHEYTSDQLFFIGFGTMWCADATPGYLQSITNYSPARYRVNGAVSNMKEFSEAFRCSLGDNMNPIKKCILW